MKSARKLRLSDAILLVAATAGALALLLIRQRDFVTDSVEPVTAPNASPAIERSAA